MHLCDDRSRIEPEDGVVGGAQRCEDVDFDTKALAHVKHRRRVTQHRTIMPVLGAAHRGRDRCAARFGFAIDRRVEYEVVPIVQTVSETTNRAERRGEGTRR